VLLTGIHLKIYIIFYRSGHLGKWPGCGTGVGVKSKFWLGFWLGPQILKIKQLVVFIQIIDQIGQTIDIGMYRFISVYKFSWYWSTIYMGCHKCKLEQGI